MQNLSHSGVQGSAPPPRALNLDLRASAPEARLRVELGCWEAQKTRVEERPRSWDPPRSPRGWVPPTGREGAYSHGAASPPTSCSTAPSQHRAATRGVTRAGAAWEGATRGKRREHADDGCGWETWIRVCERGGYVPRSDVASSAPPPRPSTSNPSSPRLRHGCKLGSDVCCV